MAERQLDKIHIFDLLLRCIIGVNPDERESRQDVVINIDMEADLRKACGSDDLKDSVDYKAIKYRIIEVVEASDFFTLEALTQAIADVCLADPRVATARVQVEKPGALRFARSVGIEIFRENKKDA